VPFTHTLRCALLRCAGKKTQETLLPAQRSSAQRVGTAHSQGSMTVMVTAGRADQRRPWELDFYREWESYGNGNTTSTWELE